MTEYFIEEEVLIDLGWDQKIYAYVKAADSVGIVVSPQESVHDFTKNVDTGIPWEKILSIELVTD